MRIIIDGFIQVTPNLLEVVNLMTAKKKETNPSGNLAKFDRLIDPVVIAAFYGLYKSKDLPPLDVEETTLGATRDFYLNISEFANKFNHFLFCLWVKKNGLPGQHGDVLKYREQLYGFLSKLLDQRFFLSVVLQFYLKKTDEPEGKKSSFVHRLLGSDNVDMTFQIYSPEFLAQEFNVAQKEFMQNIVSGNDSMK
jgi:hypothetical protein